MPQPDALRPASHRLSKSKIAAFEQCPKRLWLSVHKPGEAVVDASTEAKFAAGHAVGDMACEVYPDGIMIHADRGLGAAIQKTAELLDLTPPRPLFEATFRREGVLVRVDLLLPAGDGRWHVVEVKSSTSAKDYQKADLATQIWVLEGCGVRIASAAIRHIDNSFVYTEHGDYSGLLIDSVAGDEVAELVTGRSALAREAQSMLAGPEPDLRPGDHCEKPFSCPFAGYCSAAFPPSPWPIRELPNTGRKLAAQWLEKGCEDLGQISTEDLSSALHQRIHRATLSGEVFHDIKGACAEAATWPRPLAYLDFETIAFAVPRWLGTRPYQSIPFQFSAHVEEQDGTFRHVEFLELAGGDPRRACAEHLVSALPAGGTILAYNAGFERRHILELADEFPDLADDLRAMAARTVDLLPLAKKHYYHRDQRGSWSIKYVLPTIPGLAGPAYGELEVGDGGAAQLAYMEAVAVDTSPERRDAIGRALLDYCALDTWAMVMVKAHLCGEAAPVQHKAAA